MCRTWGLLRARGKSREQFKMRPNLERDSLLRRNIDECTDFKEFEDVLRDHLGFQSGTDCVLFIDEAQESRSLGRYVRFMKEEWEKVTTSLRLNAVYLKAGKPVRCEHVSHPQLL